jgi:putative transposase
MYKRLNLYIIVPKKVPIVQVRRNYKLQPNKTQQELMSEWLVTLRKHRNYCLAERKRGYEGNNLDPSEIVEYSYGAYCDIESRIEYGAYCPLTCSVVKHGVLPDSISLEQSIKFSKPNRETGEIKISWDSVGGIQSKRTTQLRSENYFYSRINSDVLQGNLAKLDVAYSGFFQHKRGFPAFRKTSNFNSFQFKPGQCKFTVNDSSPKNRFYSHVYLPGIGTMRYLDNREWSIPSDAEIRTVTVKKLADGWYISVLLNTADILPEIADIETVESSVGIDLGINRLVALSDGSFIENPRHSTNKRIRRRLRIRQRRVNRKVKGSINRRKAGIEVAKLHKKIANKRNNTNWKAANKVVRTADAVIREDLNIKGMKSRCKPKRVKGRFMPNGQSAKRGLNRSISDASWGDLTQKIEWVAAKSGKPVLAVNPKYTSQECSNCGHISKDNRDGEKFICQECGHIDHADTQASRTILKRAKLKFVSTDAKSLSGDSRKVTLVSYDSACKGERSQGKNGTFKATMPEKPISVEIRQLSIFD